MEVILNTYTKLTCNESLHTRNRGEGMPATAIVLLLLLYHSLKHTTQ